MSNSRGNIILYEGKKREMTRSSRKRNSNSENNNSNSGNNNSNNSNRNFAKSMSETIKSMGVIITSILVPVVGVSVYVATNFANHERDIEDLQKDITYIRDDISELSANFDTGFSELQSAINEISGMVKPDHEFVLQHYPVETNELAYKVTLNEDNLICTQEVNGVSYLAAPPWDEEDNAIASEGDIIYGVEDLYNVPIITSYLDGDNEVYFYGCFNEDNHWIGKCILNVYNEDKLVSIFEGNYDDGALYSYQTVISREGIWIVNDRTHHENYNNGETWTYNKIDEFVKDFTMEDVKEKQILTVDRFLKSKGNELLSYYKGRTSNGLYNDDTGKAYLVTYFKSGEIEGTSKEGIIKTLYQGCFLNGYFYDESNEAWYITRDSDTKYMYYQGSFSNETADHKNEADFKHGIGYEYISQKLKEKGFEKYELDFWAEYDDGTETVN